MTKQERRWEEEWQLKKRSAENGWKDAVIYICDYHRQRIEVLRGKIAEDQWGWASDEFHVEIAFHEACIKHHMEEVF